ncbi:malonate--CoA ligase ACSF3, mitochondrial-like [Montipora foliosa]|uniref:malonate--CoA ligase ACSF3, mitochondrial-like n=1 Tax=Montipora foliosa TaxID=591990 RepID=UPI0035F13747
MANVGTKVFRRFRCIPNNNHNNLFVNAVGAYIRAIRGIVSSASNWSRGSTRFHNPTVTSTTVFFRARDFRERIAIVDSNGAYSYDYILKLSQGIGNSILKRTRRRDLEGCCITFLCPNNISYVATLWAIWRNGGIAVPLCNSHPVNMYEYTIMDCNANILVSSSEFESKLEPFAKKKGVDLMFLTEVTELGSSEDFTSVEQLERNWDQRDAMIVYTSGTTGRPKGVLTTHGSLRSQITSLVKAWEWTRDDCVIHCLPLHHVHGIVNLLLCPLWVGATCQMLPKFQPDKVWKMLSGTNTHPSLFMAVPTIYSKLIQHHEKSNLTERDKEGIKAKCQGLRLMVSGSAALPEPVMKKWKDITGHVLLERYGMTEIGMALSNPLHGPRMPGCVGTPLPGTEVRIVDSENNVIVEGNEEESHISPGQQGKEGELQIRGPSVFKCYWNKPEATADSFTSDGWFKTGDTAIYKDGVYKIMGRTSVDIIKRGGYKISALEVERQLLSHDDITDCAVVGKPDPVWGEVVAAIVTVPPGKKITLSDLRHWASGRMIPYEIPTELLVVEELSRNAMGKVNKKELLSMYFGKL